VILKQSKTPVKGARATRRLTSGVYRPTYSLVAHKLMTTDLFDFLTAARPRTRISEFKSTPVRLVDLSLNGCLIELARAPHLSAQQSIWLHAHSLAVAGWAEGRIVSIKKTWAGKCRLGIAFLAPMAYEPFKKLIYGREHFRKSPPDDARA
jgi:PilZ domain